MIRPIKRVGNIYASCASYRPTSAISQTENGAFYAFCTMMY